MVLAPPGPSPSDRTARSVALAVGAGAMTVSHANDSYFLVAEFSGMTVDQADRLQTVGSGVAGVVGIVAVTALSLLVP